ncbi:MAG: His/Gly/Thr/Pro-type tRNA ligase C-terminal domain-containing protein [Candidatus Campbellbacteria bacterium]|nr:His/Gly/Thr/Pro-type tRNA ligase C-terminal domain-containing protein [Candidatus Campbellbacteria bacterium]
MNPTQHKENNSKPQLPNFSYSGPYKKAVEVCSFYGVSLISPPEIQKDTQSYTDKFGSETEMNNKEPGFSIDERVAMIREYSEKNWETLTQPVLVMYTKKPNPRGERFLYLHVIGLSKNIADMLSIHLAWTILGGALNKDLLLHINSMGDKESGTQFVRELTSYFRKHINSLPVECRESFKNNILNVLKERRSECLMFQEDAPQSITFLSESSRNFFKEIIEFTETRSIPYLIDPSLVENKDAFSETIFSINEKSGSGKGKTFATGARSDNLTRGSGMRKTVPVFSTTINIPGSTARESIKEVKEKKSKPWVYLIQLGEEARLHSFELLEKLREAKIPTKVSFGKEKMSEQMDQAERLKISITLIMGQKESLEHSVIVRNMKTHSQEIVDINDAPKTIKKLLK